MIKNLVESELLLFCGVLITLIEMVFDFIEKLDLQSENETLIQRSVKDARLWVIIESKMCVSGGGMRDFNRIEILHDEVTIKDDLWILLKLIAI